jgi:mannose-6-phosphate isomerase-like protein (cupin superfamily)
MKKVNLKETFARFQETWTPKIIADVNGHQVKLAKLQGEFVWHKHDDEDELFLVVRGKLEIRLRDGSVTLHEGELAVVPKGVEHLPVADEETHVLLVEPSSTRHTGDVVDPRTVLNPERLD